MKKRKVLRTTVIIVDIIVVLLLIFQLLMGDFDFKNLLWFIFMTVWAFYLTADAKKQLPQRDNIKDNKNEDS